MSAFFSWATTWKRLLDEADSSFALAPEDFDADEQDRRAKGFHVHLTQALPDFQVSTSSTAVYQDGTGLVECRVTRKEVQLSHSLDAVAWIVLSHFGHLATIAGCQDPILESRIRAALKDCGLDWIDHAYLEKTVYEGKCTELVGLNYLNRYFSIAPKYNEAFARKLSEEQDHH